VFLDPHLVSKEMAEKTVHGEMLNSSSDGGGKRVVFGTQTCKKVGCELKIIERLFGGSKSGGKLFYLLEVISDGGAALFGSGKLVMKAHRPSTGC